MQIYCYIYIHPYYNHYISFRWSGSAMYYPKRGYLFFQCVVLSYFWMRLFELDYIVFLAPARLGFPLSLSCWVQCEDDLTLIMEPCESLICGLRETTAQGQPELHDQKSPNCRTSFWAASGQTLNNCWSALGQPLGSLFGNRSPALGPQTFVDKRVWVLFRWVFISLM